jgi:energy-coupling factor transporter ATP-binding protein EcfA2
MEAFASLRKTLYVGSFRNAINIGTLEQYFDIQIGNAFIRQWQSLQSGPSKSHNQAIIRLVDDIRKIFRLQKLEVLPAENGQTLHLNIDDSPRKLPEIGSGLAQFVVVLANAATQTPDFILIDEPELNLHPSLQVQFLTALGSYAKKGVLFATHNVGLARACAQLIYSLRQDLKGESEVKPFEATPRLAEFLGELSFSGYRDLGFKRVLLVEGVNDLLTIQQFLRWTNKDQHVLMLSLGGSEFINGARRAELMEITRVSDDILALIDSERLSEGEKLPKDREEFKQVCNECKIDCHVLKRRAIENYFPAAAIQRVKGASFRALGQYEHLKDLEPFGWPKSENWRIAREMTASDLEGTDLGDFLSRI